jgi:hypothetical protein
VVQPRAVISYSEHTGYPLIVFARLILGKHDVVDEGIVLALAGERRDQYNHLILTQLILPAARSKIRVGGCVLNCRIVIDGGDLVRPAQLLGTGGTAMACLQGTG